MKLPQQTFGASRSIHHGRAHAAGIAPQLIRPLRPARLATVFADVAEDRCFERARDRYIDCQIDCQTKYSDGTLNQDFCLDSCDAAFRVDVWLCE